MATASARELQQLPVIANAVAPEVDTDEVSKILAVLDAALDTHRRLKALRAALGGYTGSSYAVSFLADEHPHAEYALMLWASAKQVDAKWHTCKYDSGTQIRVVEIFNDGEVVARLQFPSEPQVAEPPEPEWRPADNDEQPVTAAAIRDALRAPHWTEDHTTSLDATETAEVVTTEVRS